MAFKIGDYVLVKPGTLLEDGEKVDNWGGKIIDVTPSHNTCQIQFDSITLASITDQYIIDCYEEGSEPFEYIFLSNDLILSKRRDNAPLLESAVKLMYLRMEELDPDKYQGDLEKIWTEKFYKDSLFDQLTEQEQDNADFAISCFMGYMWDYYSENPINWTAGAVEDVCLDVIPRKVSTEIDFFEDLGKILITFFQFLDKEKEITNADTLIKTVKAIQKEIPQKAADPSNWGMAKSMLAGATASGFDPSNQADLDAYLMQVQMQQLAQLGNDAPNLRPSPSTPKLKYAKPLKENPYKNIGRNDRINVKYTDGKVVMDVKFKKVQKALLNGECEII